MKSHGPKRNLIAAWQQSSLKRCDRHIAVGVGLRFCECGLQTGRRLATLGVRVFIALMFFFACAAASAIPAAMDAFIAASFTAGLALIALHAVQKRRHHATATA